MQGCTLIINFENPEGKVPLFDGFTLKGRVFFLHVINNIPTVVNHRLNGLNSRNNSTNSGSDTVVSIEDISLESLSSALESPADYVISGNMRTQRYDLNVASRNAQENISFVQSATSALQAASDILQTMRDVAVRSAHGSIGNDREIVELEHSRKKFEIDFFNMLRFYGVDFNSDPYVGLPVDIVSAVENSIGAININDLVTSGESNVSVQDTIDAVDSAIARISTSQAELGGVYTRLLEESRQAPPPTDAGQVSNANAARTTEATIQRMLNSQLDAAAAQAHIAPSTVMRLLA